MIHAKHRFTMILAAALAGGTLAPSLGFAQPADEIKPDDPELIPPKDSDPTARAREFYTRGRKNYDLGKFRRAIALFTRAYEELPNEAFLFNIAQSYRQLDDCRQSLFFYKRFLSVAKQVDPDTKKEVDGHISALTECVKNQEDIRNRPPDGTNPPNGIDANGAGTGSSGTGTAGTGTGTTGGSTDPGGTRVGMGGPQGTGGQVDEPDDPDEPGSPSEAPTVIAVFARGGGARFAAGSLTPAFVGAAGLTAGYPIAVGDKVRLDVGAGFGFMAVPWSSPMGASGSASFITLAGHAGATYEVAPKIGVRGELDAGVVLITGLDAGNPFTRDGTGSTGALSLFTVRAGLAAEYAFSPKLSLVVTPIAFAFSPADAASASSPDAAFAPTVDSFTRLEFLAGLGYRM